MKPEFSQKTASFCLVGGMALVMAIGIAMQLSSDHSSAPRTAEAETEMYPAPAVQEAAPVPAQAAADLNEGLDESLEDERPELPSI